MLLDAWQLETKFGICHMVEQIHPSPQLTPYICFRGGEKRKRVELFQSVVDCWMDSIALTSWSRLGSPFRIDACQGGA